jgi:N-acylglucosamine 2-epimerase
MEEALHLQDRALFERAATFCRYAYETGYDEEYGGILAFTDPNGNPPPGISDVVNDWGERWDDKVWWVHSEALYATALAGVVLDDQGFVDRFLDLHEYCKRNLWDQEYGEWYCYLNRDNSPRVSDKGTWIKAAFHVPRNLMKLTLLFEQESRGEGPRLGRYAL